MAGKDREGTILKKYLAHDLPALTQAISEPQRSPRRSRAAHSRRDATSPTILERPSPGRSIFALSALGGVREGPSAILLQPLLLVWQNCRNHSAVHTLREHGH